MPGAGWYLLALVNEILDLSLIESGKLSLSQQVFVNLLSNAIKYNRPNGTVDIACADAGGGRVRVSLQDTGIGLVVNKRLIGLMGRSIGAVSTVGVGSTFWIELDAAVAPELAPELPGTGRHAAAAAADAQAPLQTLLCVEDNPANLLLIEKLIARRPGTRLLVAKDAEHGFEIACLQQPDVILMDINLPGMSGLQTLEMLRGDRRTFRMPVIALSANAMPRDIEKGLRAGFLRCLTKPIKVGEFMETLDSAMTLARTRATAAALTNKDAHVESA